MFLIDWDDINLDEMYLHEKCFEFLPKKLLDMYYPNITSYLNWSFIIQDSLDSIIGRHRLENGINRLGLTLNSELYYFSELNKNASEYLYFPIEKYIADYRRELSALSVVIVKDKSAFLSSLNLKCPEELYCKCRFLIELFRYGIEHNSTYDYSLPPEVFDSERLREKHHEDKDASDSELSRKYALKYMDYKDMREKNVFLDNMISSALTWMILPHLNFFNSIANFHYEGNENTGFIDFCFDNTDVSKSLKFEEKISIDAVDLKYIRKLLEMTSNEFRLLVISDSKLDISSLIENSKDKYFDELSNWIISGLGKTPTKLYASVHFFGSSKWLLSVGYETLFFDGQNYLLRHKNAPTNQADNSDIVQFYKSIRCSQKQYNNFKNVFNTITKQKHGTMLIVSKGAKQEADRLCNSNRGIKIEPIDCKSLSYTELLQMTKIDGAMLIDPNCICYALGVILDGYIEPSYEGDAGRGARYNSAKLYIHNIKSSLRNGAINVYSGEKPRHTMAIVISEDGYIDVFSTTNND